MKSLPKADLSPRLVTLSSWPLVASHIAPSSQQIRGGRMLKDQGMLLLIFIRLNALEAALSTNESDHK